MPDHYGLTTAWLGGCLHVSGECDMDSAGMLLTTIDEHVAGKDSIRIEVSKLAFCDSSCLAAFLATVRAGKRVVLVRPHEALRKVLATTGTSEFFEVED